MWRLLHRGQTGRLGDLRRRRRPAASGCVGNRRRSAILYGLDGIPLDAITQEQYVLEGSFDAAEFASGNYVLAVGPSLELGTEYPVLPTPSAGSTVELNGRAYTVMAVVYPLNPVTQLTVQQGAGDKFNLSFIIPSEVFRQQWPDHTLRKLFLNVDDAHIDTVQAFLDEYRETTDPSLPVAPARRWRSSTRPRPAPPPSWDTPSAW